MGDTTVLATTVLATVLDTDTDTVSATPDTTDTVSATTDTTARGPLMLSPPLSLRPRLMPIPTTDTTAMDTVLATPVTDTVLDTTTDTLVLATTDTVLATTARGPLRPSPPPMLMPRLIPTTATDTTVLDTAPTVATTDTATTDTATAMACTDTTVKCPADSSQPKTSLGITSSSSEKWIAQFGLIPTSATSFSATRLAQARNGEQEAKENQNVLIRRIKKLKPKK